MSLNVVAVMRSQDARHAVADALGSVNGHRVDVFEGEFRSVWQSIGKPDAPDVLLVDVNLEDDTDVSALASFIEVRNNSTAVVATSENASVQGIRRLMQLGISDFLPQPFSQADIRAAFDVAAGKMEQRLNGHANGQTQGRAIAFMKSHGGAGATTLAVQTAHNLRGGGTGNGRKRARKKSKVCLIDLDLQCGNAAVYLDLNPKLSILDLVGSPERLDASLLQNVMTHHDSGLEVLAAPREMVPLDAVPVEVAARLVSLARDSYEFVVLNLPEVWMSWTSPVLEKCDAAALVTQMAVAPLHQTRRRLDTFGNEGLDAVRLAIVANRFTKPGMFGSGLRLAEAEKCLGRRIDHFVRSDYKAVSEALNQGLPLSEAAARSGATRDMARLAANLSSLSREQSGRKEPVLTAQR
jgi:pilus assembly protein CpaE